MKIFTLLFDPSCNNSFSSVAHKNICAENSVNADKKKIKRLLLMPLIVLGFLFTNGNLWGQTTVTYAQRIAHYNAGTVFTVGTAGAFDQGTSQVGMYANGGTTKQVVAWRTLKTAGDNTGSDRSLQVGDEFRISVSAHTVFGEMGFALLSSPSSRSSWNDRLNNAAVSVRLSNYGNWYATYSDGTTANAATSNGSNNIGGTTSYKNFVFTCLLTAPNRMNITITDGTTTSNLNDVLLNNSNAITEYSIFSSDDWNGVQHRDIYWNTNSTAASDYVRNTLTMPIGGSNGSFTISGVLPNGRAANSTSTASVNALTKSGSGSLTLSGNNTYTGTTTISAGTLLLGAAGSGSNTPLGTTAGATTVSSGSALNLNGFTLATAEGLTINGTGISSGGALINSSGTGSTWAGTVVLGSDASVGGSGNTTLSGVVSGANSLTKVGAGTVTLSNTNTFGGASKSLTIAQGTVSINSFTNALGNSLNTFALGTSSTSGTLSASSGTGTVARSFTVAAGGGTLQISGSGTPTFQTNSGANTGTLNGEFTVNCSNTGGVQFNLGLSGAGGMTINSAGSGVVTMGTAGAAAATYTGDTKITAGTLELGFANMLPNSSKLVLNGGTFSTGATAGFAETVGTLQLTENSTILLGTGSHNLNFSASNSTAWTAGKTLTITGWTGTASGGTAGRIYVGSSGTELTQAQLDAINFSTFANTGAQILSTGEIVPNFSATITSAQTGNWNSTSTWVGGVVPTSVDNVVIASTHAVTVTADATCKKVTFTGTGGVVSVNTGITLTVSTSVNVDQADQNNVGTISGLGTLTCTSVNIGIGVPSLTAGRTTTLTSTIATLTASGGITLTSRVFSSNNNNPTFNLQSGTFTCTGITTVHPTGNNTATVSLATGAQSGTLKLSGSTTFTLDGGGTNTITLNGTGATVEYSGTSQTVLNTFYTNLTLSGSGNKTLAAFTVSGKLSLQGTAVAITTAPSSIGTLEYKGSSSQTTTAIEWPSSGVTNVIIDNSAGVTMGSGLSRTISGSLTLTSGTLTTVANTLTYSGSSISRTSGNIDASNALGVVAFTNTTGITLPASLFSGTVSAFTVNGSGGLTLGGNTNIGTLNLTSGTLTVGSANTVTINSGGSVARTSGSLASGTGAGKFSFPGTGTVSGTVGFYDVDIAGGVNFGSASTINGILTINSGGFVNTNAPIYANGSILKYNTTGSYGRSAEWSTTSGAGYPNNVQVSNNTTLNLRNGSDLARQIAGDLTVDAGSTLSLESMTSGSFEIGLTVLGNVTNNGTITLATSTERLKCVDFTNNIGATTTLSSANGGDLELTGSLIDNATFNSNNRAVFFTGSGVQDVSGMGTFNIDYILSNKASGSIRMLTNLLVEGPNGGNAMTLNNSSDILNLNGFALTLGKASVASTLSGSGSIRGSSSSSISILGAGALGTIRFDQTTPGTTNALNSLTINRTSSGSVTLANPFTVEGNLTITNGNLNLGTNRHTANALTLGSTAQTTSSSYGGTSSPAENINTTYFATALGYVNVGSCTTYNLTSTSATACLGSAATVTLSNTTTSELPIGTYTVHYTLSGANTGSGTSTMVVTSEGSGTFITANITNNGPTTITINFIRNGCVSEISANNTATIIINAVQTASVSASASSTTICSGASVTFTATPTNGGASPAYQWSLNGSLVSGQTASTFTSTTLANGDVVTVEMTSNASPCLTGSPATSTGITMTVNPLPTASISGNNGPVVCSGSDITFSLTGTSGAVVTYNLNGGSNTTATLTGGSATVTVTAATATQTLNLVSVTDGTCPATLSGSSTVSLGGVVTWDGTSWSPSAPTATSTVIFTGNYTIGANFDACSISVSNNAVVSVTSGFNVNLNGAITVATGSSFTLNNNANLLQSNPAAVNTGNIVVRRQSNPLIRLDYTLWSSPVAGQGLYAFSPFTFANRFYTYTYNATTLLTGGYSNSALGLNVTGTNAAGVNGTDGNNVPFGVGRGYLIRVPYNHPTAPAIWTGTFTGVPTNGDETVTLNNTAVGQRFNLIGNPYPSTLSMSQFVSDNSSAITGTLYFWRKTNSTLSSPGYCTWAGGTFVSNGEAQVNNPLGVIQVGQGFLVEASATGTSVTFNNGQRIANNANQVFRLNNSNFATPDATTTVEYNRIWLNMTSATEFAQMSVGYNTGATQEVDVFDGKYFNDGPIALNSIIGTTDYAIQGRALPFATNDVVPLSYKVTNAGNYTIALDQADGLFTAGAQDVFLKDNLNNTYTNLNTTSYTFASEVGTFNNRFEIVYENQLSVVTPTFTADNVVVYKNNEDFVVNSGVATMSEITVYDIRGRVLQTKKGINATETRLNTGTTNQVLLLQIKTTEGLIVTKKVIN